MKLAVVMPVWNHLYFTMKTVDSLFPATETQDSALVLVNDGSTDETQQYAGDLFVKYGVERVKYVSHKENMGVNAAWNTGIRCARAIDAEYIAIVNNDLLFAPGWDTPLIRALEADPKLAVVSPMSTFGRVPEDFPVGSGRNYNPAGYPGYMPILGAAFMFRSPLVNEIGFFPQEMRIYFGDNWIVQASQNAGYECGYAQDSYVHHLFCQTTSGLKNGELWAQDGPAFEAIVKDMKPFKPYRPHPRRPNEELPVTGVTK